MSPPRDFDIAEQDSPRANSSSNNVSNLFSNVVDQRYQITPIGDPQDQSNAAAAAASSVAVTTNSTSLLFVPSAAGSPAQQKPTITDNATEEDSEEDSDATSTIYNSSSQGDSNNYRNSASPSPAISLSPALKPTTISHHPAQATYQKSSLAHSITNNSKRRVKVQAEVRTRIPSEYGGQHHVILFSNNVDGLEHMALVYGYGEVDSRTGKRVLLSKSLEAVRKGETAKDRALRGCVLSIDEALDMFGESYNHDHDEEEEQVILGMDSLDLSSTSSPPNFASTTSRTTTTTTTKNLDANGEPLPTSIAGIDASILARIHSCCFTGETLGSLRCDCKEQLASAMHTIASQPHPLGLILYLIQEGRGIGLKEKLKAYNLIDQGLDTLEANLALGHPADARTYSIASAMLADLNVASVKLLTNNPDKMASMQKDGVVVSERVAMYPKNWDGDGKRFEGESGRKLVEDRDAYLVTKAKRMGHMLDIPQPLLKAL